MKNNVSPLEPDNFYHIYNRGINGGHLFFEHRNYLYFLRLITEKVKPVAKIHSYCLLKNHFHILAEIRSERAIRSNFPKKEATETEKIISHQFSNAFNSYTQAINKHFGRTGKLFELPFRRKHILSDRQLMNTILYINKNPEKHGVVNDCLSYRYSSVQDIMHKKSSLLECEEVLILFGNPDEFNSALRSYEV